MCEKIASEGNMAAGQKTAGVEGRMLPARWVWLSAAARSLRGVSC